MNFQRLCLVHSILYGIESGIALITGAPYLSAMFMAVVTLGVVIIIDAYKSLHQPQQA